MRPQIPPNNKCPRDRTTECPLTCKYNHFESDELTIDAWELKCLDCGWRETIAYRQEEDEPLDEDVNPRVCPFCNEGDLPAGRNPCEQQCS